MSAPAPLVSVLMLAYNHGRYIRRAMESVLCQQTNFPVEIVLGEDCSTDDTRAILLDFARVHPLHVRLLLHERNVGVSANFAGALAECRGEFIALLEGDDHWLGTEKLQRQVDFLRTHPDCSMCFHDVLLAEGEAGPGTRRFAQPKPPTRSIAENILARNCVPTCSVVFRRTALPSLPAAVLGLPMLDWPMWVLLSRCGALAFLDEVWGCYRVHPGGVWSSQSNEKQLRNAVRFYDVMADVLPDEFRQSIGRALKVALAALIEILVASGRWREARQPAWRFLINTPRRFRAPLGRRGLYWRLVFGLPSREMISPAPTPSSLS